MSFTLPTGSTVSIAGGYAAAKTTTAASNAANCVVTVADNTTAPIAANDFVEVTSGWGRLDKRVCRVSAATSTTITLEGIDTTDTAIFPTGTGTGSIRKISSWVNLTQIKGLSSSGGDLQFADITAIDDTVAKQMPTVRSAMSMTIEVFDDPSLAYMTTVKAASDARTPYALKLAFSNGSKTLANAYWSLNPIPTVAANQALTNSIGLSYAAEPVRYTT